MLITNFNSIHFKHSHIKTEQFRLPVQEARGLGTRDTLRDTVWGYLEGAGSLESVGVSPG